MAFTTATNRLIQLATELDLNPQADDSPYRGSIRVVLDGRTRDAGLGAIYIGAQSGRVLRMTLSKGLDDPRPARYRRHTGYHAARTALAEYRCYALRIGLIPEPQDAGYVPTMTDDDLADLAAALLTTPQTPDPEPTTITSGRATWHCGTITIAS